MDPEVNGSNLGNPPVQTPPAVTPPVVPVTDVNPGSNPNWEQMYKGLQGTYNTLYTKNAELQTSFNTLNTEHERVKGDLVKAQNDLKTATDGLSAKDQTLLTKQSDVEKKDAELQRVRLIAEKFPSLMGMEIQGMLPVAATTEELQTKLTAFLDTMNKAIDSKAIVNLQNTPPGPVQINNNMPPVLSEDELYNKIQALAGSRIPEEKAEYERLYPLYIQMKQNPTK